VIKKKGTNYPDLPPEASRYTIYDKNGDKITVSRAEAEADRAKVPLDVQYTIERLDTGLEPLPGDREHVYEYGKSILKEAKAMGFDKAQSFLQPQAMQEIYDKLRFRK
jgi:hypothetical protein